MFLSISPAMTIEAIGSTTIEAIASRLLQGVGFSNGWAEFGPKNPPPLVPACLIATSAATGPRAIVWVSNFVAAPSSVVACAAGSNVIGTPMPTSRTAITRRHGQEHEDDAPHQVDVEVAQVRVAPEPAEGRQHHAEAGGRGDEHQPDDARRAG